MRNFFDLKFDQFRNEHFLDFIIRENILFYEKNREDPSYCLIVNDLKQKCRNDSLVELVWREVCPQCLNWLTFFARDRLQILEVFR